MNPFDLPVHPLVVHFPLAMLTAAWVCLVGRYALRDERWGAWAGTFETIGVATLPVTVIAGFIDTRGFDFLANPRWSQPLVWHAIVSFFGAVIFAGHWWWHRRVEPSSTVLVAVDLGWATLGLWSLVLTGAIAGEMVYAV